MSTPTTSDTPAAPTAPTAHADVVVVGAGPAGSAAAHFLALAGHDVVLIEKASFPRDKVCGDGLTPRAVQALRSLDLHEEAEGAPEGWDRQEGLRMYGGGVVLNLPWPLLEDYPAHSVTATRALFDETLARNAERSGARLWEQTEVTGPVWLTSSQQRVAGVTYRHRETGVEGTVRAPLVIATDGVSSRFALQLGLHRIRTRPMGVAVRAYYTSPRASMGMMEGFLELRRDMHVTGRSHGAGTSIKNGGDELLPGYGWIFPLDNGEVNVGWGLLNTSRHFRTTNYRKTLDEWVAGFPPEWGIRKETMRGKPLSAGLPMGHNRKPMVHRGALLVGDAAGMVNPFNGEGISYAIEAAQMAAEAADTALRTGDDDALLAYPGRVADAWGGYYTLGRLFVRLIGHPEVMRLCTVYGMPRRVLMQFVFRMMAHLVNHRSADATDRVLNALSRAVPAA